MSKGKHSKKYTKKEDKFEPILQEFKEEYEITTPGSQWVSYFSIGALTAGAIVYLFTTPLLVLTIPHVGYLFASVIIAGILLTHSYNEISTRVSLNLLVERELVSKEIQLSEYKTAIQTESSMYAYFTINATYLVGALSLAFFILPTYGLTDGIACGVASILPAVFLFILTKLGLVF
mmetsp:Transcript_18433/g.19186  ORF Transcript_18433/g.19186 Transcript_18433/m.19186 type:complete len:177 (+) Transcript_18433:53-583(+)